MEKKPKLPRTIGLLHYTAPPVVGGVESVIEAHSRLLVQAGYPTAVIAGRGKANALPQGVKLNLLPELDTQGPTLLPLQRALDAGEVPAEFEATAKRIADALGPLVDRCNTLIIHNVFTKHFNLPLTAALHHLIDQGTIQRAVAWCHDFSWTSPSSRAKVYPGYPWDLLRSGRADTHYVVVSRRRQRALAELFGWQLERIQVIYNGVDPEELLGLSPQGAALAQRLGLLESDLNLLMPVRVTRAKNIEYALHLVAHVKAQGWKPRLVLTGPPDPHDPQSKEYFRSLQKLRARLGVEDEMRFVFESGLDPAQAHYVDARQVGDLYRLSDVMLMPSHREGFAMPVLEAGLAGVPVVCTNVPAAEEIGAEDVMVFDAQELTAAELATRLLERVESDPLLRLRRRVRQNYTWEAIFTRQIEPLLLS